MTPTGPDPFWGGPEDPGDGGDADQDAGGLPGDRPGADAPRGWLPPEDRLWRHPSEMAGAGGSWGSGAAGAAGGGLHRMGGPARVGGATGPGGPYGRSRHRRVANALVGTGAAAAVVAGMVLLVSTGSGPNTVATGRAPRPGTSLTASTVCCRVVPVSARAVSPSMVSLVVTTGHGTTVGCGLAIAAGGRVATTYDTVAGARSIVAVTSSGRRERATVVATDRASDVALLQVAGNPPPARFADQGDLSPGGAVLIMGISAGTASGTSVTTLWGSTTIRSVGVAVPSGSAAGMAAIETAPPPVPVMAGEALLQPDGRVAGILDASGQAPAADGDAMFLPSSLVVGVAGELAGSAAVHHGWLDVTGQDAPAPTGSPGTGGTGGTGGGAQVVSVVRGGAATGALRPGDVIRSVQGMPVRTMAELRSRLYVLDPGTQVTLGVVRGGQPLQVAVTLSASP